jgi:PAS domain S-box-containing protein
MTKDSAGKEAASAVERPAPLPSARHARQMERRVFARRIIAGGIVVATVILVVAGIILWNFRQSTVATALADLDAFDLLLAAQTERTFENVELVVSGITEDLHADGVGTLADFKRARNGEETFKLLRQKLSGVPQLHLISLVGADGDVINHTRAYPFSPFSVADREYFIALRDHPEVERFITRPVLNRGAGTWSIYLAHRVSAPDGSFLGVVVAAMTLDYFEAFFGDVSPGTGRGINLWRDDGTLLVRYPAIAGSVGKVFDLDDRFRRLVAHGGSALFWTKGNFTPATMAIAERKLRDFPLVVAVGVTEATILKPWYTQAIAVAAGVGILLLALALAAWLFWRQLSAFALVTEARAKASRETEARHALQRAVNRAEQAVRRLRQSEMRFRDIAEVSGDWIWESDMRHRITSVLGDVAFHQETHGISSLGAVGKTRWEMARGNPDKDPHWRAHKADLDAHRPFRNFRFMIAKDEAGELHFRVSGKPVFDETGRFLGYRGTASNETDLVAALRRAERAEMLLREAIDSISEGFAIFDNNDRLVMCNDAYKDLYPESAAYIVPGASFEEILRGGLASGQYSDAVGREEEWLQERLGEHRDLNQAPIEQPLRDGRWAMISERRTTSGGRAGLRIDITALKKVQQSLHESQERLARAQRVANTGSIERDFYADRIEWSDETYRIMGLPCGSVTPTSEMFMALIHPDDRPMMTDRFARHAAGDHAVGVLRYRIIRPDGEVRMIYAESNTVLDKNGKPTRVVAVVKDVTEAEAAAQRQAQLEAQLRHSDKLTALGTLAGGIAHDLNNILVPIQALTKLVMRDLPANSAARADLETVVQASMQARELVRQILAFSRKQDIVKQPVDLVRVVRETLVILRSSIPTTVELVEDFNPVPRIHADAGQLHQVIINLVSNAAHAIGDRIGKIIVGVAPAALKPGEVGVAINLTITDTGCGMDDATTHRIFEPFYTTKPVGEGTGLGLSVVHGIVTGHGGSIEVRSEPGKGSEFIIRLPSCGSTIMTRVAEFAGA